MSAAALRSNPMSIHTTQGLFFQAMSFFWFSVLVKETLKINMDMILIEIINSEADTLKHPISKVKSDSD